MAIRTRRPLTSSLRGQQFTETTELTKKAPEKNLLAPRPRKGGRNAYGRITVRHRGGGAKRRYRIVDFRWTQRDVPGVVNAVEYDPNRNVPIALVFWKNGAKTYQLCPETIKVGSEVMAGPKAEAQVGSSMALRKIPVGFMVHSVELSTGRGAKVARSAGTSVQLVGKEETHVILKMPSREMRKVPIDCWATIGVLSNADHRNLTLGKAGRTRHRGFRPSVRGMAMNPIDHPHGGGEGRSKSGSHPTTPWGKSCKGARTRKRKSNLIIRRRPSNKK